MRKAAGDSTTGRGAVFPVDRDRDSVAAKRGYYVFYRDGEVNRCPGCGRNEWLVGRVMAECGFCATALPIEKAVGDAHGLGHLIAVARAFVSTFMNTKGVVDTDQVADTFKMSKSQLAETAGLPTASISKSDRRGGQKTQARMTEMLEIISRIREWAGGDAQAMAWYRSQPIPALDGRTPEALVKDGRAAAVRDYLDHLALGGYA